jgi:catechol 2,3-dioxygenase-like lactoylglutathione lyase family enzyme
MGAESGPLIRSDSLSLVTVMCNSISQAVQFYVGILEFNIRCDQEVNGERLVVATPPNLVEFTPIASLRFREAVSEKDKRSVGNQAGDGVFLQVETDDWDTVYKRLKTMGVKFVGEGADKPRQEKMYQAVTIYDPMGNKVNIIQRTTTTLGAVFMRDVGE